VESSVFFDFHLPNAATWFYFSLLLTVALFFQFGRVLSVRNLDLLALYLLVPGFLLLQEAQALLAASSSTNGNGKDALAARGNRELVIAYTWLLAGSGYWFGRALFDLALVRRPLLYPNLNPAGLGWLGLALLLCLTAVAVRRTADPSEQVQVGKGPIPVSQIRDTTAKVVTQANVEAGEGASPDDVRFWVERSLAMLCHIAVVLALLFTGLRHFGDWNAGLATGTLYLLLPYTAFHIGQFHHVWPTAFLMWAVFCYRRPGLSGWLLGLAAGSAFFPLLLFPLWVGFYAKRGAGRFTVSFLLATTISSGIAVAVLWADGRLGATLLQPDWLPWKRPQTESLWTNVPGAYRLPIFVVYVAFLIGLLFWPKPKNLSHLIALSAAVLIGVQFWHADRGGVYVLWYIPLLLLMVFRPNLSAHEPPVPVEPAGGMVWRLAGAAWRKVYPRKNTAPSSDLAV
jgi:hypothetical protein